jgi:hypothetical protein
MATVLSVRENNLKFKLDSKLRLGIESKSELRSNLKHICISGSKCKNRFCMVDLLDIYNISKYIDLSHILCKECLEGLWFSCFLRRKTPEHLQKDVFDRYVAVKTAEILTDFRIEVEDNGCGCSRLDCKIDSCNAYQRDHIHHNFNSIYFNFAFMILTTDTRSDNYRWLGTNQVKDLIENKVDHKNQIIV